MRWCLFVVLPLLAACGDRAPAPKPASEEAPSTEVPAEAPPADATPDAFGTIPKIATDAARSCETAADCKLTTAIDGSCCDHACGPESAYDAAFVDRLEAHRRAVCDGHEVECPVADCPPMDFEVACEEGRCVSEGSER